MTTLWPWIAVAGLGALHGLSPANGWMFAAARGVRSRDASHARRALWPIAVGHLVSMAVVAAAFANGLSVDPVHAQAIAGLVLIGAGAVRVLRGTAACASESRARSARAGHVGIALWSFLMATAHGAGLMLVPALVPLCLSGHPARDLLASGAWSVALAVAAIHTTAMLVTTGVVACVVCRGLVAHSRRVHFPMPRHAFSATLGLAGVGLLVSIP